MKTVAVVVLAIVSGLSVSLHSCEYLENPNSRFDSYSDMEDSGLMEKGWAREYFPRSASDIHESHNLDTNRTWASFNYRKGDDEKVKAVCRLIVETLKGAKYLCPPFDTSVTVVILRSNGTGYFQSEQSEI